MRRLAHVLLGAALSLSLLAPALAQEPCPSPSPPTQGRRGGQRGARLQAALAKLDLNDSQKAKIKQIMQDQSLQPRARMQAIMAVLTPAQQQQLRQLMPRRGRGGGGGSGGGQATPSPQN